jgi:hypothetical protein
MLYVRLLGLVTQKAALLLDQLRAQPCASPFAYAEKQRVLDKPDPPCAFRADFAPGF